VELSKLEAHEVQRVYARWAFIYDFSFGQIINAGRRRAVAIANQGEGRVLEAGVGTGLSLPRYADKLEVTGIDISDEMLKRARGRVGKSNLKNIAGLHKMDAANLTFPEGYFDTVVAMYVMTVVPDPVQVMSELERVCADGGTVIIVNHFFQEGGARGVVERAIAQHSSWLGWRADLPIEALLGQSGLTLTECSDLPPFGLFSFLKFEKTSLSPAD
jgi:phosphatidylethanolamine/phosphatidyl-N-methylethanolamine N-methyltransferase